MTADIQTPQRLSISERRAMNISLGIGLSMLFLKWSAYLLTHSMAIFSDAMETIVHIVAVAFAWWALRVMYLPPDEDHHFGHEKVGYFSSGIEGLLIIIAAIVILYECIHKLVIGVALENVGIGVLLTAVAGTINALLGIYLINTGKSNKSLVITANGKHVMTDAWTSAGAVGGLLLANWLGQYNRHWLLLDPIVAGLFGANIIREGIKLIRVAVDGLMDKSNKDFLRKVQSTLDVFCANQSLTYHRLRLRESGNSVHVDFHLQFVDGTPIESAHLLATQAEKLVVQTLGVPCEVMSHLESLNHPDDHDMVSSAWP